MYTAVSEVATDLGREVEADSAEYRQIEQWIGRVEGRIQRRIPTLETLAAEPEYRAVLVGVVSAVVARKARNPDGKSYERVDDYGYGLASDAGAADLQLTAEEWDDLLPAGGEGAFSIIPHREARSW